MKTDNGKFASIYARLKILEHYHTCTLYFSTINLFCNYKIYVKWVPCYHGMLHPQVANRGDGLQIWRVAANILNKQPTGGGPGTWGVRRGGD
jgi:hypothetical protein